MIRLACTLEIPLASATSNWVQGIEKSGESRARGKLHPVWPRALRLGRPAADPTVACTALLEAIAQRVKDFDVVHSHIDWLHLPLFSRFGVPFLTTMHGRLDLPGLSDVVRQFSAAPFVSISDIWLLIEWPAGEEAPTKYWLSTLPANIGFRQFVDIVKLRWRIERDYHELKQEVGLGSSRGEAGVASTITQHCALPPTDFWSPSEKRFPLRNSLHQAVQGSCNSKTAIAA